MTARDYFSDVEAYVANKYSSFRLSSLSVWEDIVQPPVLPACLQADDSADALAAQEQAAASRFHEVKIKLANDCQAMANYNAEKNKVASKLHVLKVLHEKAQLAAGKQRLHCNICFFKNIFSQPWSPPPRSDFSEGGG